MMDINVGMFQWFIKFFHKKTSGGTVNNEIISNKELAEKLQKSIIRKFNKRNDVADMQLISKFNAEFRFLLCAIDICSKYTWVIPLKDKKGITITNAFQKIVDESNCKLDMIWVDDGSKFYNKSIKSFLQKKDIEKYSRHNEGKSDIAKRFIRTIKNKIHKHLTPVSKNVYIDKLDDIVNKYNISYHSTIKMEPVDVKKKHAY